MSSIHHQYFCTFVLLQCKWLEYWMKVKFFLSLQSFWHAAWFSNYALPLFIPFTNSIKTSFNWMNEFNVYHIDTPEVVWPKIVIFCAAHFTLLKHALISYAFPSESYVLKNIFIVCRTFWRRVYEASKGGPGHWFPIPVTTVVPSRWPLLAWHCLAAYQKPNLSKNRVNSYTHARPNWPN